LQFAFIPVKLQAGVFDRETPTPFKVPIDGSLTRGQLGSGTSGEVFSIVAFPSEFRYFEQPPKGFAIKRIAETDEVDREIRVLTQLNKIPPNNRQAIALAPIYTGFRRGTVTYLVGALADMDLDRFMKENPNPSSMNIQRKLILLQLRGLAQALNICHTKLDGYSIYNHDLKPENILVFKDPAKKQTTLKITDWGSADAKPFNHSGGGASPRSQCGVNPPYTAPKCRHDAPTSRRHDIWSLGCIFAEILIWYTKVWSALEKFRVDREAENDEDWCMNPGSVLVGTVRQALANLETAGWHPQVSLIKWMLSFQEASRPTANQVASHAALR